MITLENCDVILNKNKSIVVSQVHKTGSDERKTKKYLIVKYNVKL